MPGYYGSKIRSWVDSQLQSVLCAGEEEFCCCSFCGPFPFVLPVCVCVCVCVFVCVCVIVSKTCLSPCLQLEDQMLQCAVHMKLLEDEECVVYLLNRALMCGLVGAHVLEEPVAFQLSTLNMAAAISSNVSVKLHCITSQNSILLKVTAKRISGRTL